MKKAIFLLVLISLITFSCKKEKKKADDPIPPTNTVADKLIKKAHSTGSNGVFSSGNFIYNGSRLTNMVSADSSLHGSVWVVSSSSINITYSGDNWSTYTLADQSFYFAHTYIYDNNGKLLYDIESVQGDQDTIVYSHTGNKSASMPLYFTDHYDKSYYTDGDLDSTVSYYLGSSISSYKYNYHPTDIDKASVNTYFGNPLHSKYKKLLSRDYYVGTAKQPLSENYSYTFDPQGYFSSKIYTYNTATLTTSYAY